MGVLGGAQGPPRGAMGVPASAKGAPGGAMGIPGGAKGDPWSAKGPRGVVLSPGWPALPQTPAFLHFAAISWI